MRVIAGVLKTMLLAAVPLSAVVAGRAQSPAVLVAPPASLACPVSLLLERRGGLELRQAADGRDKGATQELQVGVTSTEAKSITEASVVVHLFPSQNRVLPARSAAGPDRVERFHLTADGGAAGTMVRDLSLHDGYVSWVELTAVRFADGSAWRRSGESQCAGAPSFAMRVGAPAR